MMMSSATPKQNNVMSYILALGGQFIGWVGAILSLISLKYPELQGVAVKLMSIGPILAAPAMTRSGWMNHQPSWVFTGLCFFVLWIIMFFKGTGLVYIAPLMFSVSFLLCGLSNIAMDEVPGQQNRVFDMKQAFTPAGFIKMLAFIVTDLAIMVRIGFTGTLQVVLWPVQALTALMNRQSNTGFVPDVLSPKNLWQSRRFGAFYFALCGLTGMAAVAIPSFTENGKSLMDTFGAISALTMNYSLFFSGIQAVQQGKSHWLYRLLLVGPVLATIGSSFRATQPWGFALDQFGSRLNEMYMCGLPLVQEEEGNDKKGEEPNVEPFPPSVNPA
jgi:hypothetical protein